MSAALPFRAFGVDMGSHLAWTRNPQGEAGSGRLPQGLLDLATQVLGAQAQTWLHKPHQLLDGLTPAVAAAEGDWDKVRSILNAIQNDGVV